ncbi:MAG TPA: type II/IV secretion system protein [Candidatus Onthousia faecipullorum]|uniref:Type II/IV secretion system protein n=1 Tax=Candidatus Onthousia faecipullorum TaxID=2840887 RepID=A0A9D1GAG1_9FIRM|nr:type II/IV secretion system protein [Candidatus Onthousia faecipullorum]
MVTYDMTKTPVVNVVDDIIANASRAGASDIHFDPREDFLMVRIRVDGDLQDYTKIPKIYERNLITRIKLIANMNITESRLPQDGSIKGTIQGINLETRVSTLPTNEGEKCVIRILDYSRSLQGIDALGFNEDNFKKLKKMIAEPNGIILITGATGSGKSTTVYSILQVLNKTETNIITVEDPIEMNLEGLNQVQVNSEIGLDFATVLRSILRQDPNVILIGEIRDSETAKIAVRASITGHLVLSTIHTNNSLSTIERLLDMNVERYLLSSALSGIISQKLAKMICPHCRIKEKTTPYQKKVFKMALNKDVEEIYNANPEGCDKCNKGYHGRIAIQEVLMINDEIRNALNEENLEKEDLNKLVYTSDVITMLQDGLLKVLESKTSFDEIYKIIDVDDDLDIYCKIRGIEYDENNKQNSSDEEINDNKVEEQPLEKSIDVTPIQENDINPNSVNNNQSQVNKTDSTEQSYINTSQENIPNAVTVPTIDINQSGINQDQVNRIDTLTSSVDTTQENISNTVTPPIIDVNQNRINQVQDNTNTINYNINNEQSYMNNIPNMVTPPTIDVKQTQAQDNTNTINYNTNNEQSYMNNIPNMVTPPNTINYNINTSGNLRQENTGEVTYQVPTVIDLEKQ